MRAFIEIPARSSLKYELKNNVLTVDRPLSVEIPFPYGFILDVPKASDGDQPDVFILENSPMVAGSVCEIDIVGVFHCTDQGVQDDKYVGVIKGRQLHTVSFKRDIQDYLETYKEGFVVNDFEPVRAIK